MEWAHSLNEAINYIEEHLEDNISIEDISSHIFVSPFHFQRVFTLLTGYTVSEYIRNRRLSKAGEEFTRGRGRVLDAALRYGYETPESFTKAFQRFHGITPKQAMEKGSKLKSFNRLGLKLHLEGGSIIDYRIEKREGFEVCVLTRDFQDCTDPEPQTAFWREYFSSGLHEKVPGVLGLCTQEDPSGKEYRYGIGCMRDQADRIPEEFELVRIQPYVWAIFTCEGIWPDSVLHMWDRIYREWLPQSGYELISAYDLEYFGVSSPIEEKAPGEIWIPVKERKKGTPPWGGRTPFLERMENKT